MKKKKEIHLGQALQEALFNDPKTLKIPWYRRLLRNRSNVITRIRINKYRSVFQGEQEKARRRRQIAKGMIKI